MRTTIAQAKASPLWGVAFAMTLLIPFMLIWARVGIEICGGFIVLSFLWQSWRTQQWHWLRTPFAKVCGITWLWLLLVVTPLAVTPASGLVAAALWFRMPLLVIALRYWVLATPAARTTLAAILLACLALVAVDCYVQFVTGTSLSGQPMPPFNRLSGPFKNPKVGYYLAMLGLPVVALCAAAALQAGAKRALWASLAALMMIIAAILLSGERAAFMSIIVGCGSILALLMLTQKRLRRVCLLTAVGIVGLVVVLYSANPVVQARAAQLWDVIAHYGQSPYGMLSHVAMVMGAQHWVHGIGLNGFAALCPELPFEGSTFRGLHPHNYYAEWFSEAGLPGVVLFIAIITVLLREGLQQWRQSKGSEQLMPIVLLGVIPQHFLPLISTQSFFGNWGAMLQWYGLALVIAALPKLEKPAARSFKL